MKKRTELIIGLGVAITAAVIVAVSAATLAEVEPNDTKDQANPLYAGTPNTGAISPISDTDYYSLTGVNTTWGFIALLDTVSSTTSTRGTLTALRTDGTTVLQSDTGSWERGSGIALQNYADDSATHYLRVNEEGNDATITPYTIRYYQTIVSTQPEVEPNNTRSTGTPSSFTMNGVISPAGDVDCFAFHGRAGDTILIALNGDPEGNGSPIDPVLELITPSDAVLKSADISGTGGKEFIEYVELASEGVYAYCVRDKAGGGGAGATYTAGLVRNGGLYRPSYTRRAAWQNPRPGNYARIGDLMIFRLAITNTSPLTIPGNIRLTATYSPTCLGLVSVMPSATTSSTGYISWNGQKSGLVPGEVYSVTMTMLAKNRCSDPVYQGTGVDYYFTGYSDRVLYTIWGSVYLPLTLRSASP